MHIICSASLDNFNQRNNLCESVKELGGMPLVAKTMVCLEYEGKKSKVEKFIQLFEKYKRHNIHILDS